MKTPSVLDNASAAVASMENRTETDNRPDDRPKLAGEPRLLRQFEQDITLAGLAAC
jgi:hypothetical protein